MYLGLSVKLDIKHGIFTDTHRTEKTLHVITHTLHSLLSEEAGVSGS